MKNITIIYRIKFMTYIIFYFFVIISEDGFFLFLLIGYISPSH